METTIMRNRYGGILAVLISALLIESVSSAYRYYSYYYYSYRYYRYSSAYVYYSSISRSSKGSNDDHYIWIIIGIAIPVVTIASIVIPICCRYCRKRRNSSETTSQTDTTAPTEPSPNAEVGSPQGQALNGNSNNPYIAYTKSAGYLVYTPRAEVKSPGYNEVTHGSNANGEAFRRGQGLTDQDIPPPDYDPEYVNFQDTRRQNSTQK